MNETVFPKFDYTVADRVTGKILACLIFTGVYLHPSNPCLASNPELDGTTQKIRGYLEAQFKETTGLGFKEFHCNYPNNWPTNRELVCEATDDESDRFIYRLIFETGQDDPRASMMQPVTQLNPSGLSVLSRPCEAFLLAFAQEDWDAVLASLSPELRNQLGLDGLREILAPLRSMFGNITESQALYYATPSPGLHQLEFSFVTELGEAVGRFRLRIDGQNNPQIVSFLLTAKPGSSLQSVLLEDIGKKVLARFFDQPIKGIEGPFDSLMYVGDNTEVSVMLQDGSSIATRIEQHGSTSDVDGNDYRFQILDAKTLIGMHLSSTFQSVKTIDCPTNVVPDGGLIDCTVTFSDGSNTILRLMRRGGEHRLVEAE
jgi:hypothetical protein